MIMVSSGSFILIPRFKGSGSLGIIPTECQLRLVLLGLACQSCFFSKDFTANGGTSWVNSGSVEGGIKVFKISSKCSHPLFSPFELGLHWISVPCLQNAKDCSWDRDLPCPNFVGIQARTSKSHWTSHWSSGCLNFILVYLSGPLWYYPGVCVYVCVQSLGRVWLFCNPMDCSPPGSSVLGILQTRILEWVVLSHSGGSSRPRDGTLVCCIDGWFLDH